MRITTALRLAAVLPAALALSTAASAAAAPEPYPAMAPLAQYLMAQDDEVALARTAAPKAVSDDAEVMVLTKQGYVTVAKGSNGFLCLVERGWAGDSGFADFWNPKQRAPICFNAAAARSYTPIFLMKTRLALEGRSKKEITEQTSAALDSRQLPELAPGAMCYMMSRQQYLNDEDKAWRPHLMFFAPGSVAKTWGGNLAGSPLIAAEVPEERVTIFMMVAAKWSDGTPATPAAMSMNH